MKYKKVKVPEEILKKFNNQVIGQNDFELEREYHYIREEIRKLILALRDDHTKKRKS